MCRKMKTSIIRYGLQNIGDKNYNQTIPRSIWLDQTFFIGAQGSEEHRPPKFWSGENDE
jgi:hypothetical protein